MSVEHDAAETLDVQGENCPMPVVKTKQAADDLSVNEVSKCLRPTPGA